MWLLLLHQLLCPGLLFSMAKLPQVPKKKKTTESEKESSEEKELEKQPSVATTIAKAPKQSSPSPKTVYLSAIPIAQAPPTVKKTVSMTTLTAAPSRSNLTKSPSKTLFKEPRVRRKRICGGRADGYPCPPRLSVRQWSMSQPLNRLEKPPSRPAPWLPYVVEKPAAWWMKPKMSRAAALEWAVWYLNKEDEDLPLSERQKELIEQLDKRYDRNGIEVAGEQWKQFREQLDELNEYETREQYNRIKKKREDKAYARKLLEAYDSLLKKKKLEKRKKTSRVKPTSVSRASVKSQVWKIPAIMTPVADSRQSCPHGILTPKAKFVYSLPSQASLPPGSKILLLSQHPIYFKPVESSQSRVKTSSCLCGNRFCCGCHLDGETRNKEQ